MYIEPNTKVNILRNVPLDKTYRNTLWFDSETAQYAYFVQQHKYMLEEYSYQRVQRNVIRVGIPADNLYDCNYVMFQNKAFGSKWFYAFITSVEYKNNNMAEITFEIDVMQTWFFDYSLRESFVEREHALTDEIGENLVPENLELGEYITDGMQTTGYSSPENWRILIASTCDANGDPVAGAMYANVFSGCRIVQAVSVDHATYFIKALDDLGKGDAIVGVSMCPTAFVVDQGDTPMSYTIEIEKSQLSLGNYVPRNAKLLTYPYNFLYVTNQDGLAATYPYEFFTTTNCQFELAGDCSMNPMLVFIPRYYKGVYSNTDEKLTITGFPQCCWNNDSYANWLAINGSGLITKTAISVLGGLAMVGAGIASGGTALAAGAGAAFGTATAASSSAGSVLAGGLSVFSSVSNALQQVHEANIQPPQSHNVGASGGLWALGMKDFAYGCKHITEEFARIIDDYFDVYGYATNRVKVPNISSRPQWNYIKTAGCNAWGSVPADDMALILSIYDNGVTFWKNPDNVGNYSVSNSVYQSVNEVFENE